MKPRLLDLFCCEGGAAKGYADAGFAVVGVDLEPRFVKRYPFEFHAADALTFVAEHGHQFDAIHASPPCQAYSITRHSHGRDHPDLVAATRAALIATSKPYVIENVVGAPLLNPTMLCWSMFRTAGSVLDDDDTTQLRMERHRLFESNVELGMTPPCQHPSNVQVAGAYGGGSSDRELTPGSASRGGYTPSKAARSRLLEIQWMTMHGLSQSIPPFYTEHIGHQLIAHLAEDDAA